MSRKQIHDFPIESDFPEDVKVEVAKSEPAPQKKKTKAKKAVKLEPEPEAVPPPPVEEPVKKKKKNAGKGKAKLHVEPPTPQERLEAAMEPIPEPEPVEEAREWLEPPPDFRAAVSALDDYHHIENQRLSGLVRLGIALATVNIGFSGYYLWKVILA